MPIDREDRSKLFKCLYLGDRQACLDLRWLVDATPAETMKLTHEGWQKCGNCYVRNACPSCNECRSYRVLVDEFVLSKNQKRIISKNRDLILSIAPAKMATVDAFNLYLKFLTQRQETVDWEKTTIMQSWFVHQQYYTTGDLTDEWRFRIGKKTVAICLADKIPDGFIAVVSYYDPVLGDRSLGTYMILSIIMAAKEQGFPYVYLGNFVQDCRSMNYKARYQPAEELTPDGSWRRFANK